MTLDLPVHCAICKKQVDKLVHWIDPRTWCDVVEAHCHGEVDVCELDLRDVGRDASFVGQATAFAMQRIAG